MRCPVDGATLLKTERAGVEIDHCPQCRGVWLDRGELDKIVERGRPPLEMDEPAARSAPGGGSRDDVRRDEGPQGDDRRAYGDKMDEWRERDEAAYRKKGRKGFLEDLFDF